MYSWVKTGSSIAGRFFTLLRELGYPGFMVMLPRGGMLFGPRDRVNLLSQGRYFQVLGRLRFGVAISPHCSNLNKGQKKEVCHWA